MKKKLLLCALQLVSLTSAGEYTNQFSAFIDSLYWQAQEDGLDYAIQNNNGAVRITNGAVRRMQFDNHGGFRIGTAYRTPCDDYIVSAFWTRFHTAGNNCASTVYPATLFPVWSNPSSAVTSEQDAQTCMQLHLDMFDAHITAPCNNHERFDLMTSVGVVYARINQSFAINMSGGQSNGPVASVLNDAIIMKNNFQGAGPKVGVTTIWDMACRFSLVARANTALIYGKFKLYQNETITFSNSIDQSVFLHLPCNTFNQVRPIVDMMLGVRWDRTYGNNDNCSKKRCNFYVEAGWELNYFFAQNMLMRFTDDITPGANIEVKGDLATQGLTVRFNIGF